LSDKKIIEVDFSQKRDIDASIATMEEQLMGAVVEAHKDGIPSSIIIVTLESIIQYELDNLPQDDE
jgi:hypothetical protein